MRKTIKTILALTAGVMSLASCNKLGDMGFSCSGNNEIRFGSNGVRVETKAFTETTNNILQTNGFKVAAVIDTDNSTMFNKTVTYSGGFYTVSGEHYYYPSEGTMSFYGAYPASEVIAIDGTSGEATLTYVQNADTDLVAAKATEVAKQSTAVNLTFDHLLSQVSIKAKGENSAVDYKVKSVIITNVDGGTYSFDDNSWTPSATTADYTVYSDGTGMAVSTSEKTAVGEAMSFVPGTVSLNVVWECYNKGTSTLISSNDQSVNVTLEKGKHSTLNLTLPSNSSDLSFVTSVGPWQIDNQDIVVKPKGIEPLSGVFTVNDSGKKVKFAPGNLFWDGEKFGVEEHQYDFPTVWDPNHVGHFYWSKDARVAYSDDYDTANGTYGITPTITDTFFAADGGAITGWTVLSSDEWQYLIDHSLHTEMCEEVKMYYWGDGGFTYIGTYEQVKAAFEAEYPDLNFDELYGAGSIYVVDTISRNIAGVNCIILKPDGFEGEIKDIYTAEEWAAVEADYGLVALPLAGNRLDSDVYSDNFKLDFWSTTTVSYDKKSAYYAEFNTYSEGGSCTQFSTRYFGYSVRLVQVVE